MHILENEVHLGPIVVKSGATLSNAVVTVITWPGDEPTGVRVESGDLGTCYAEDSMTVLSFNMFNFVNAHSIH